MKEVGEKYKSKELMNLMMSCIHNYIVNLITRLFHSYRGNSHGLKSDYFLMILFQATLHFSVIIFACLYLAL